tara:strand:+ start:1804 stop:2265 length:462 start_codon:yes stop_codon:yes gene_type:complete
MEDCPICYQQVTEDSNKKLPCSHTLCYSCYLRLDKTICPLCRSAFIYSNQDQINRNQLNLDYTWQPPNEILNYIPPNIINSHQENINQPIQINTSDIYQNVQTRRRKKRRRRKNLSIQEINERRRIINKKKKMKFQKKHRRFLKTSPWWELPV